MTDREVMKMAFDAFEDLKKSVTQGGAVPEHWDSYYDKEYYALEALRQALAQPEQESISTNDHLCAMLRQVHDVLACTALPMKRKWVGLTDDEIEDTWGNTPMMLNARDGGARRVFARAIEAKLKEKNNGSV